VIRKCRAWPDASQNRGVKRVCHCHSGKHLSLYVTAVTRTHWALTPRGTVIY